MITKCTPEGKRLMELEAKTVELGLEIKFFEMDLEKPHYDQIDGLKVKIAYDKDLRVAELEKIQPELEELRQYFSKK